MADVTDDGSLNLLPTQKPYLIRALIEWCQDQGGRPHLIVDATWPGVTGVPDSLYHEGLVLNLDAKACPFMAIKNDHAELQMAFSGQQTRIYLPMASVRAIFSPDLNGIGMSFESFKEARPEPTVQEAIAEEPKARPSFLSVVK